MRILTEVEWRWYKKSNYSTHFVPPCSHLCAVFIFSTNVEKLMIWWKWKLGWFTCVFTIRIYLAFELGNSYNQNERSFANVNNINITNCLLSKTKLHSKLIFLINISLVSKIGFLILIKQIHMIYEEWSK